VEPDACLAHRVPSLDRVVEWSRLSLVEGTDHLAGRHDDASGDRVVLRDEAREDRLVPPGARRHEVDQGNLKGVRGPKRSVVGLVDRSRAIRVAEALLDLLVIVRRVRRRVDRERGRTALCRRTEDALLG
jgi:hypothetical protein